jgi:hypothetical protein
VPAPIGNQNARKGKLWNAAILRALEKRSRADRIEALDALAEKLLQGCDEGDITALKELGDRLDGKPAQMIQGDPDNPLNLIARIERKVVDGA